MKLLDENTQRLRMHLDLLSQIEPTGMNFLTCYLDTGDGRWQAWESFRSMQLKYRKTLSERNQIDFDHASKMIEVFLDSHDTKTDSIMIFCRGILGGQYFLSIPVSEPLGNKIIFRSTPSVTALASLVKRHLDENAAEQWNIHLNLEKDVHDIHQGLLLNKHIERDENSYALIQDEQNWPAGAPVELQARNESLPSISLDLVA